jgi:hypothetical protein
MPAGESGTRTAPSWVAAMQPARWYRLSGDRPDLGLAATAAGTRYLLDTDPARDPHLNPARTLKERLRRHAGRTPLAHWSGRLGFSAITEAWNSAVYASRFGRCGAMIVFGGGHANYYGSDVHAFDLDSREWRRISDGYTDGPVTDYGAGARYASACYPDGSPLPPHTYDYVQYDASNNDYLLIKGQTELGRNVQAVPIPHCFNLAGLRWRHGPRHPSAVLNSGGFTTWDPGRRVLWGHSGDDGGGNAFIGFAPDGANPDGTCGRWLEHHPSKLPGIANHNAMQLVPPLDLIVLACHARDALAAIDPAHAARPVTWLRSSGERPSLRPYAALQFAPRTRSLVYFSPDDEGAIWAIDVRTDSSVATGVRARWHRLDRGDGLNPIDDAARASHHPVNRSHCFGRLRIATFAETEIAVLVRHVDSPVYALRLP